MEDYLVPLLLGFSFSNLWICALLVFSLQTTNRSTCGGYLVGRALTIVALSVAVSLLGRVVNPQPGVLNLISGVFLLVFAAYLAATSLFDWVPPWKRSRLAKPGDDRACDGQCASCPAHQDPRLAQACEACGDDPRLCAAEEPELAPLTRGARELRGRKVEPGRRGGFLAGMALGSLRGAALCSKLAVLVPVLLGVPIGRAVGMGITFSVSSSIYPLLGFVAGAFALKLVAYKRWLFGASCTTMAGFGVYYLVQGFGYLFA
jgi:hypothetical protein